jgi:nitrite reductase/ring-hydroxylating ferredoxin subunit
MQVPRTCESAIVRKALCRVEEIAEGGAFSAEIPSSTGGFSLVLTRVDGKINAFHNECPHAGRRLDWAPGRFLVEGRMLICAAHGASFVLDSGECIGGPCKGAGLRRVAVRVEDGEVVVG